MRQSTRAPGCVKDCSIRPIRRVASGPIPPIGRQRMRRSWRSTASPAAFTARSPRGALCPGRSGGPTTPNRKSAHVSSMCSPHKRTEWICSSAPSGSRGQPRRSAWPISSTTSNGYCVCVDGWPRSAPNGAADRKITSPMRRRSTKHHPNIAEIVQSAQHPELLEVSSYVRFSSTSWVCVVTAISRPSWSVITVCQTIVV